MTGRVLGLAGTEKQELEPSLRSKTLVREGFIGWNSIDKPYFV